MMLPTGAVPAPVVGDPTKAALGPAGTGLNQHTTLAAGHADKSFSAPVPRLARRKKPEPFPILDVAEIVSGWPDCARVMPLNSQPPRALPERPLCPRKKGRR